MVKVTVVSKRGNTIVELQLADNATLADLKQAFSQGTT